MNDAFSPNSGIFVLSSDPFGAETLRRLLASHPDVCCPRDLSLGRLSDHLLTTFEETVGAHVGEGERRVRIRAEARERIDGIMQQATSMTEASYWCDAGPHDVQYLDGLHDVYPDALYVCLYRNCMDVVDAVLDVARDGGLFERLPLSLNEDGNLVNGTISYWTRRVGRLQRFKDQHSGQTVSVRFEDLVFSPDETVSDLLASLEIDGDASPSAEAVDPGAVGGGSDVPLHRVGDAHREKMNAALRALDYPTVEDDFNLIPNPYVPTAHRAAPGADAPASGTGGDDPAGDVLSGDGEAASPAVSEEAIEEIETLLHRRLVQNPAVQQLDVSVKVVVDDLANGVWTIDLGEGRIQRRAETTTDCTIALDFETLTGIAEGSIQAVEAQEDGRLRARGDEEVVVQLGQIL